MVAWLAAAWAEFRWADALDVALFAGVLYALFAIASHLVKRQLRWALAALGAVYFLAHALDLYLMSLVFQGLWAALVLGLLIVFQDDLRRYVRRASAQTLWPWKRAEPRPSPAELELLAETAFELGEQRVGALVVLAGSEPLEQLEGGTPLDGRLSPALLHSIFDPHSVGHDGAAIIEGNRLARFGVHLPLCEDPHRLGHLGTRHSAGVGLSERSDALAIIVSEERGSVSVAQGGELALVTSSTELLERLVDHRRVPAHAPAGRRLGPLVWRSRTAFAAVAVALAAWLLFAYRPGMVERSFVAPIEYDDLPRGVVVDRTGPMEAQVTLQGSAAAFRLFDPGALRIRVDAGIAAVQGNGNVRLVEEDVDRPPDLHVARIEPRTIHLSFERAD
ncbi:MAG: diadenylate cyclase [Pirellulales bacterium]